MLIVPPNSLLAQLRRPVGVRAGDLELRLVEVVARVAGKKERNNKSAYPEDQDRHRSAYREAAIASSRPHRSVIRLLYTGRLQSAPRLRRCRWPASGRCTVPRG